MAISRIKKSTITDIGRSNSLLSGNNAYTTSFILVATQTATFYVYPFYEGSKIGTLLSNPSGGPGQVTAADWSPSGNNLLIGRSISPLLQAWQWNNVSGIGTKYTDPASALPNSPLEMSWSPSGNDLVVSYQFSSPYINAYRWSNGFGTKYANPATLPATGVSHAKFSPSGSDIAVSQLSAFPSSAILSVYPFVSGTGFGTRYASPATTPSGAGSKVAWSPSGNNIAVATQGSGRISVYSWSAGFGTKYANPATLPTGNGRGVAWSPSGGSIAVMHLVSPYLSVYRWSSGFQTQYTSPTNITTNSVNNITFK